MKSHHSHSHHSHHKPTSTTPSSSTTQFSNPTKKSSEDQRKKDDEAAAAQAFEEYVATFQDTATSRGEGKVWVKAGTYDAGRGRHEDTTEKGKLYKPTSRFIDKDEKVFSIESGNDRPDRPGKKKTQEKKKSNLEIFKEELKIIQEEREERHRLKKVLGLQEMIKLPPKPGDDLRASLSLELDDVKMGSIDDGDPNTTNIYLGNLPTKISEQQLMELFGKYGPLASVKVMWPRTDEEKSRNRLSGFVAFMSRRDGERALKHLAGKEILGTEVKLGWGKAVPIPAFPIYIPPTMMELTMPPPPSGLPFNAQVERGEKAPPLGTPYPSHTHHSEAREEFERIVSNSTVKVVIPTDRTLLALIHRMIEFVAREGPMFEAMIMNREISNHQYRFLFENQGPSHIYYRWKLYSILQGESTQRWRTEDFRMFRNGSIWRPPNLNPFTQGMPDELIPEDERDIRKGTLSNAQRTRLERMLRTLTPTRPSIAELMIFSIEHAEAISEITLTIKESLSNPKTSLTKKMARLYVLSDVLYNCTAKGMNAVGYRKGFKIHLPSIFQEIHFAYQTECERGEGSAECFKERVLACCRVWDEWGVYPSEFLIRLQNIFLGLLSAGSREEEEKILSLPSDSSSPTHYEEIKRKSPPRAQLPPKSALNLVRALQSAQEDEDIDGVPLDEEDSLPTPQPPPPQPIKKMQFLPSKWETIDPEEVAAGAVTTTSKWDLFEEKDKEKEIGIVDYEEDEDVDGEPMVESPQPNEEERRLLREVELKVLAYEDDLESGGGGERNVGEMVDEYRRRLLGEMVNSEVMGVEEDKQRDRERDRERSRSRSREETRRRRGKRGDEDDSRRSQRDEDLESRRSQSRRHRDSPPPQDSPHSSSGGSSGRRHKRRRRRSRSRTPCAGSPGSDSSSSHHRSSRRSSHKKHNKR